MRIKNKVNYKTKRILKRADRIEQQLHIYISMYVLTFKLSFAAAASTVVLMTKLVCQREANHAVEEENRKK